MRQLVTQKWFENKASLYHLYTSITAIEEIDEIENPVKRRNTRDLILDFDVKILELSEESINLAKVYMNNGAIPRSEPEDAYHLAIASVNQLDALAS